MAIEKDLEKALQGLEKLHKKMPDADLSTSKEIKKIETLVGEIEENAKDERDALTKMAKQNNNANNAQIAKEIWTYQQDQAMAKGQKKHFRGAKKSRTRIENMNKEILSILRNAPAAVSYTHLRAHET